MLTMASLKKSTNLGLVLIFDISMINKILFPLTLFFCVVIAGDPAPPEIPEIQAFPEHEKITLYWDK